MPRDSWSVRCSLRPAASHSLWGRTPQSRTPGIRAQQSRQSPGSQTARTCTPPWSGRAICRSLRATIKPCQPSTALRLIAVATRTDRVLLAAQPALPHQVGLAARTLELVQLLQAVTTSGSGLGRWRSGRGGRGTYGRVDSDPFGVLLAAGLAFELEGPVEVRPNRLKAGTRQFSGLKELLDGRGTCYPPGGR